MQHSSLRGQARPDPATPRPAGPTSIRQAKPLNTLQRSFWNNCELAGPTTHQELAGPLSKDPAGHIEATVGLLQRWAAVTHTVVATFWFDSSTLWCTQQSQDDEETSFFQQKQKRETNGPITVASWALRSDATHRLNVYWQRDNNNPDHQNTDAEVARVNLQWPAFSYFYLFIYSLQLFVETDVFCDVCRWRSAWLFYSLSHFKVLKRLLTNTLQLRFYWLKESARRVV